MEIELNNKVEIEIIDGVYKKKTVSQNKMYYYCREYFEINYRSIFFAPEDDAKDIFQNAFITLWRNIENKKIYVEDGIIKGKLGEPLKGNLKTYFMGIARNKFKEWVRKIGNEISADEITSSNGHNSRIFIDRSTEDWIDDNPEIAMKEVIYDCLMLMPKGCYQILSKFYDEGKKLDQILKDLHNYSSKDALKTAKNKCLKKLKESSLDLYDLRNK